MGKCPGRPFDGIPLWPNRRLTCRRPIDDLTTDSGIVFVTLEDETGYTNVVQCPELAERQRRETFAPVSWVSMASWEAKSGWCICWPSG